VEDLEFERRRDRTGRRVLKGAFEPAQTELKEIHTHSMPRAPALFAQSSTAVLAGNVQDE
jgi:hypothetical protein